MATNKSNSEHSYEDFMPGDVIRWENGVGVIVDGIVQVGRPQAYGYAFSQGTDNLVALQRGCNEGRHIAPERIQPGDSVPDGEAITRGAGAARENITVVPPEAVIEIDPDDHAYKNDDGSQRTDDDVVFNPEHIEQPRYLDGRYYD